MAEKPDEILIGEYSRGNKKSLEKLYERYQMPLFNYIARLASDRALAEDILQEVFEKVIKNAASFSPAGDGSFAAWLYRITVNLCRDKQGSKWHTAVKLDNSLDCAADKTIAAENPKMKAIERALGALPAEQKEVVLLRVYGNMSFKEIAGILDCPLNTVLGRMHYAVKSLKRLTSSESL
ncbi:MAG: sigma-70 family RNA polymerase sigma factor [Planctomycetes bacterium]|nr:sigma-70 family RNA polymerase sigma factor [Planctomycetota bacterium]